MAESKRSAKYETVRKYYASGLWDEGRVKKAVVKGWITAGEYKEIVGREYQ